LTCCAPPRLLPPFPTRRSSDLAAVAVGRLLVLVGEDGDHVVPVQRLVAVTIGVVDQAHRARPGGGLIHAGHGTLPVMPAPLIWQDRKSTRLNSSHVSISYAVFC